MITSRGIGTNFPYVKLPNTHLQGQPACMVTQRAGDALRKAAPSQDPAMGCTHSAASSKQIGRVFDHAYRCHGEDCTSLAHSK